MAIPRPLKVFRTHLGFFDTVIASPSMKAALEAWGTRQNLFHEGLAEITNDPKAVMAALAKPGVVLRRAAGSSDQFSENPSLPALRATKRPRPRRPPVSTRCRCPNRKPSRPTAASSTLPKGAGRTPDRGAQDAGRIVETPRRRRSRRGACETRFRQTPPRGRRTAPTGTARLRPRTERAKMNELFFQ